LILDFRQVLGIDSSAVMSLIKLRQVADREGFVLVLSEIPPPVSQALRVGGLLGDGNNLTCRVFTNTDGALEWCEDQLLAEIMTREEALTSADQWLAEEIGSKEMFARLASYLKVVECKPGDVLIHQGDSGDSLYLLYAGRVTVIFRTPEGVDLRLRSMVGHTIVGEMGLYRTLPRGATVRADQSTIAYRLSLEAMTQMEQDDPTLAHAFHKLVIRTLSARLDFANREVASLQR
jgi:SulP family sulfate permease